MKRKEVIATILLAGILLVLNTVSSIRRAQERRSSGLVVQTANIQVSVNASSMADLGDLPGIGPVLAERIVTYRKQRGGFRSLEELKEVKGIGDKLFEKILPYVKL
jgi:competence protein ComEA